MAQTRILVVDDEPDIRQLMGDILEDEGYVVETAENGETARAAFNREEPDLVLLDIWMPDVDGITLLKEWSASGRLDCPVVMISGHGTLETAVEATRLGAVDFVQKPLSLAKLLATVKQALGKRQAAPRPVAGPRGGDTEPQGSSPQMQLLRQKAEQAACHDRPIFITGEAGSGKETLAAWIHRLGGGDSPFTVLDTTRVNDDAVACLFGDGAESGALEAADTGTLYIPEAALLTREVQVLLSAILEARQWSRPGEASPRPLRCRVIASVSGDPMAHIDNGDLLEQLYLQLNVLPLHLPALRDRPQDVPELVSWYTDWFSNNEGLAWRAFPVSALNRLRNHGWPGNERELRNVVQRLLIMGGEGEVSVQEIEDALKHPATESSGGPATTLPSAFELPLREAREQFEREYLVYQLRKAGGSVGKLSDAVGMERTHLYRKLRSLGIDPKTIASESAS
ncbi:sigma-54-dependent Fis family transcriptional regulator [Marinihelvus fidelis]|uniref:Sigma-54-dependent Fis family transcriptional regulator n=1 Tax=Marinihelvus fidelis TaxID=2613842 RepID=A0A5N0TB07_9GAMM|nr:sigma-54 dependent transcriptional regulator [Marinihelvus fidelis]KAA9131327.1 sigma-54-dependent Fis family transcriptional regulator [Marinihelvus fidelis]